MKILYPVEVFYPSQAGGAANSVHYLTKYLDRERFDPLIVATDKGVPTNVPRNRWIDNDGDRVKFVRTWSLRLPLVAALTSLKKLWNADIVHLSSVYFPTSFVTAIAACLLKKKL